VTKWAVRSIVYLSLCAVGWGQTIEVEPVTVTRGSANIFRMSLKPRPDRPVAALQWEFLYPNSLRIEPPGVVTSGAVEAAGKTVLCVLRPPRESNQVLACVLAGGVDPLAGGTMVIVRFVATPEAARGVANIRIEKIVGASPTLERTVIENVRFPVTIR